MTLKHVHELIASVKDRRATSGWLADMAVIELGELEAALRIVMTSHGASVSADEYKAAQARLEAIAHGRKR